MAVNRMFRTDPATGPGVPRAADKLMRWNAVAAVVSLLVGGLLALGVVLTRWQAVHLLPPDIFYQVLTAHGINMLIFWIIFFEMAVLYFAASTLLKMPPRHAAHRWAGFWLMVIGALINNYSVLRGDSERDVHLVRADGRAPTFYLGPDPVRGRRADRLLRVLRHAGRRAARANLQRLGAAGHLRRDHRRDHRGVHHRRRARSS